MTMMMMMRLHRKRGGRASLEKRKKNLSRERRGGIAGKFVGLPPSLPPSLPAVYRPHSSSTSRRRRRRRRIGERKRGGKGRPSISRKREREPESESLLREELLSKSGKRKKNNYAYVRQTITFENLKVGRS